MSAAAESNVGHYRGGESAVGGAYFGEKHAVFRRTLREWLAVHVLPHLADWEQQRRIPVDAWRAMGEAGLFALNSPPEFGGAERDLFHSVVLLEELGRTGCSGFRVAVAVHAYMATAYLALSNSWCKREYWAPAIAGQKVAALALTEAQSGSDLQAVATRAIRCERGYLVTGRKSFVANGRSADFAVLSLRLAAEGEAEGALSLAVVDMRAKGVTVTPLEQLGWHCSDTCEIAFNDVFLPTQALIGRPGMALPYVMHCMQLERVAAALLAIGGIEHCLQLVSRYTKGRMLKDGALADYQTVRHTFAGLVTELEAARQLAYHSAWLLQAGVSAVAQSAMAKLKATELAVEVARQAMQLHGAHGFQANTEVARIARDAFAATMAAGASEVMRDLIAVCALDDANLGAAPLA